MSKKNKQAKGPTIPIPSANQIETPAQDFPETVQKVKMTFSEHKYYGKTMDVPHFEKGKVYEVVGADMIQRWLKRGGVIVQGELEFPENKIEESSLVETPLDIENSLSEEENSLEFDE